jgi:hypothetical protein
MDRLARQLQFVEEAGRLRSVLRHTELTDLLRPGAEAPVLRLRC